MAFDRSQVIQGPAIVSFKSYAYYTEGDIIVESTRETWEPKTSIYGALTKRAASSPVTKITFTPAGAATSPTKYITAYTPANIGDMLFDPVTDYPVEIWTIAGKKITWQSGAITKTPDLILSPIKTIWGAMEISCIGKRATDLTDPGVQAVITSAAFADTSFDSELVASAPYQGALGALGSPFDAIVTEDGFTVSNNMTVNPVRISNYGIVNWVIAEVIASVRFIPANFDDAELEEIFQLQGSTAILPGGDVASLNQDLVITGGATPTAVSCTISNVGPDKSTSRYGLGVLRAGEVELFSRKVITTGSGGGPQPQITLTFS